MKNFTLNIVLRILALSLLIGLLLYFALIDHRYLRSAYLLLFIGILIAEMIWYVNRTNRDISSFLQAILQNDFTTTFSSSGKGKSFDYLYKTFNQITKRFKSISSQKQAQHLYLEMLVEHVKVGIISFDEKEKIHLINDALKKMLGNPILLHLKGLENVSPKLLETMRNIQPGQNQLIKIEINNRMLQLALNASNFKIENHTYTLISVQNIKNELENNELDAWQKLIRVLTHEIMNSVTPIGSLTETLQQMAQQEVQKEVPDKEVMPKLVQGLEAIKSRSEGLHSFTQAYRSLTRIPPPAFSTIDLIQLVDKLQVLLEKELKGIDFKITTSQKSIPVIADSSLLEQVLINLIKNAIDAVEAKNPKKIQLQIQQQENETYIKIIDNGPGIEPDKLDKIFIPFFTTKTNGSGIGLAFSREIMRLHNGTISVDSQIGKGTIFTVKI